MAKYYEKLESLRGIAAFAVVLYHSPFYQHYWRSEFVSSSYLFVDFFFILSGFVITLAYQDKIGEGLKFREYFILRLGRIYPLHFVLLICWGGWIYLKWLFFLYDIEQANPAINNNLRSFISNLFLVHSLNIHNCTSWNFPSWSISVEFVTYLIFFVFTFLTKKFRFFLIPLAISIFCYYYVFHLTNWKTIDLTVINGIFRCLGGFFAGVALSQIFEKIQIRNVYLTFVLEVISVVSVYWLVSKSSQNIVFMILTIPAFIFAVYVFSLEKDGFIGKILKTNLFLQTGKYSYSIYLTHALILDIVFCSIVYLYIKPDKQIFFWQSYFGIALNIVLMVVIYFISKFTYQYIEQKGIDKTKKFVNKLRNRGKIEDKSLTLMS